MAGRLPPGGSGRKAAQREGVSKGEWVRRALEEALTKGKRGGDPLARLSSLGAPTADIEQMLAEIASFDAGFDHVKGIERLPLD
jgi:hypothetical protein